MPFWLAVASKERTALSVLFSLQYFIFPFDAFRRFTELSGHWPFAGDSEASSLQPMALGMGLWSGLTVYFKEEFEAFVFLFLQLCTSSSVP